MERPVKAFWEVFGDTGYVFTSSLDEEVPRRVARRTAQRDERDERHRHARCRTAQPGAQ